MANVLKWAMYVGVGFLAAVAIAVAFGLLVKVCMVVFAVMGI